MFAVAIAQLKKHFRTLKNAMAVRPLFLCYDNYQLDQINREPNQKKHICLEPKGWKYGITIDQNFVDKDFVFYALQEQYHMPSSQSVLSSKQLILDLYYHSKRLFFLLSFITNKPTKF